MHQTSSRGESVTQAAVPSAFTHIQTTDFDQLKSPRLSHKHTTVDKYFSSVSTAREAIMNAVCQLKPFLELNSLRHSVLC